VWRRRVPLPPFGWTISTIGANISTNIDDASCDLLAKMYKSRYRTSTGESNRSMCDIRFCISWPEKSQDAYRTRRVQLIPFLTNLPLCLPNEDFGKRNRRSGVSFRGTLRGCEYWIWATNALKITRKDTPDLLFRFTKSSFGEHSLFTNLCLTNDDFGKRNRGSGVSFRGTLRGCEY